MAQVTKTHGESWTVPANVQTIRVTLRGEQPSDFASAPNGEGGVVEGTLSVTPGETLYFRGSGSGGGQGTYGAGQGGDYIDIRQGGDTLSDQVAVAAGGGGGGNAESVEGSGGDGGADTGEDGGGGTTYAGKGGTQSAGGAGGDAAGDGARGTGGDGEKSPDGNDGGGGGGGGYYGGGGGGFVTDDAGGGGGGSNYTGGLATVATNQRGGSTLSTPEVDIEYAPEPTGVAIDSLTETGEAEVTIDASATTGYDALSTWTLYRSTDGTQGTAIYSETGDGALSYVDTNAPTGETVSYTAELDNLSGTDSTQSSLKVRLRTVEGLTVTAAEASSISIDWDPVPNAGSYEILRATASGTAYTDYTQIDNTAPTDPTDYTDSSVTSGTTYYYTVRAETAADPDFDSRYPGEVSATATLRPPTITDTTADSQTAITVEWARQDNNPNGDIDVIVDSSVVATVSLSTTEYQATGFSEATSHDLELRRDTGTETATSPVSTQYTKPAAPDRIRITPDEDAVTHTIRWDDNSSGETGVDILERRNGGSQTAIATGLPANAVEYETDRQDRVSTYEYQLCVFAGTGDARAQVYSESLATGFPAYANYWAVVETTEGDVTILRDAIESGPAFEHTALHGFSHALKNSDVPLSEWGPRTRIEVFHEDDRLLFGQLVDIAADDPQRGVTTVEARGPLYPLTTSGPGQKVTYTNALVYEAIEDYLDTYVTGYDTSDWLVRAPPADTVADDTRVLSSDFSSFGQLAPSVGSDVPVDTSGSLALQPAAFVGVEDDFATASASNYTVEADVSGSPPYHIDGEYATVTASGEAVSFEFTPSHTIPADRVGVAIHGDTVDTAVGSVSQFPLTLNGTTVAELPRNFNSERWGIYETAYGDAGGADLMAGTEYALTLQLNDNDAEYNIDALVVYDTAYGPYTFDDVESLGDTIAGPQPHQPVTIDLADESRANTVSEARVDATLNGQADAFAWDFTTTGGSDSITETTTDATFDFLGASQYGTTLSPSVTLAGFGSNAYLSGGVTGQELTSLDISLTTVEIASVGSIELTDQHFRNLQRLHRAAGMRWVAAPDADRLVDGLVAESFAVDAPIARRVAEWTQLDASRRRQMEGYANAVTIAYTDSNGDDQTFVGAADQDEVDRVGEEVRVVVFDPSVETNDQARNAMVNERRKRIARDRLSGTVRAVAKPILPGFRYDVPELGGYTALERVRYTVSEGAAEMTLQFARDDDVTERVLDTQATVDEIQERL